MRAAQAGFAGESGSAELLERARRTQRYTLAHLADLGGAPDCQRARRLSYRRSDAEPEWSDLWYVAAQLGADAALLAADPAFGRCTLDRALDTVDRFWDRGLGGFLARGTPDGRQLLRPDRYCDDHGHLGIMLLDAWRATRDRRYLERAERAASFLLRGGVWDGTFGGGFWWNSRLGDTDEGKPAQTNALVVQLFAELYGATGQRRYRDQARRGLDWLDAHLFDAAAGLYRWSVHYADPARRRGEVLSDRLFNYDQGIAIEALLALYEHDGGDRQLLDRARAVAQRLETAFWHRPEGGFNLVRGQEQVFAIYGAWLTPSLLALARHDRDPRWPALARHNVAAMNGYLLAADGGYFKSAALVEGRWQVDSTRDTAANAGMQWAQAALAGWGAEPRAQ